MLKDGILFNPNILPKKHFWSSTFLKIVAMPIGYMEKHQKYSVMVAIDEYRLVIKLSPTTLSR